MKRLLIAALVPFALMGASIGHAHAQAKLTKNFFKYDNIKYRRSGASSATLGSAGIVRKTLLKAYNFERKESLPKSLRKKVGIKRVTRVKGSQMKELKHKGMFKYLGLSVKDTISQLKKSELDLVKIELDHGKYKDAVNASDFVKKIRQIKPKGGIRTIVTIWLIVEAKTWNQFEANVRGNLNLSGATIQGDDTVRTESQWTIQPKTIIAYEMAKVKWSKGDKIDRLKVDKPNM